MDLDTNCYVRISGHACRIAWADQFGPLERSAAEPATSARSIARRRFSATPDQRGLRAILTFPAEARRRLRHAPAGG